MFFRLKSPKTVTRDFCPSGGVLRRYTVSNFVKAAYCLVLFYAVSICASAQLSTATMFGNIIDQTGPPECCSVGEAEAGSGGKQPAKE
jgi:hypothetical protein